MFNCAWPYVMQGRFDTLKIPGNSGSLGPMLTGSNDRITVDSGIWCMERSQKSPPPSGYLMFFLWPWRGFLACISPANVRLFAENVACGVSYRLQLGKVVWKLLFKSKPVGGRHRKPSL